MIGRAAGQLAAFLLTVAFLLATVAVTVIAARWAWHVAQ